MYFFCFPGAIYIRRITVLCEKAYALGRRVPTNEVGLSTKRSDYLSSYKKPKFIILEPEWSKGARYQELLYSSFSFFFEPITLWNDIYRIPDWITNRRALKWEPTPFSFEP